MFIEEFTEYKDIRLDDIHYVVSLIHAIAVGAGISSGEAIALFGEKWFKMLFSCIFALQGSDFHSTIVETTNSMNLKMKHPVPKLHLSMKGTELDAEIIFLHCVETGEEMWSATLNYLKQNELSN